jgi:mRNA interferase MazF
MPMSRGDVIIVSAPGDYGIARPAVIVQSNAIPESHASVVICPVTSELVEADFRVTIEPGSNTGMRVRSQLIADKPVTIRRERIRERIGQLGAADMARLNVALALVMGLAD